MPNHQRIAHSQRKVVTTPRLQFICRIEHLNSDKDAVAEDPKKIDSECKSAGFDTKAVRKRRPMRETLHLGGLTSPASMTMAVCSGSVGD